MFVTWRNDGAAIVTSTTSTRNEAATDPSRLYLAIELFTVY